MLIPPAAHTHLLFIPPSLHLTLGSEGRQSYVSSMLQVGIFTGFRTLFLAPCGSHGCFNGQWPSTNTDIREEWIWITVFPIPGSTSYLFLLSTGKGRRGGEFIANGATIKVNLLCFQSQVLFKTISLSNCLTLVLMVVLDVALKKISHKRYTETAVADLSGACESIMCRFIFA